MVEYILKIDIDSNELVRKLNEAFSQAKLVVGGGSVSGGGGSSGEGESSFKKTVLMV